jgi:uncharacterized protein YmfQ (DUF2313 family)
VLHKDILKQLFPLELGGVFDDDLALEGGLLDQALARSEQLLRETFPDTSAELLAEWERICNIFPGDDDPIQERQTKVIEKFRARGGLSVAYFLGMAERMAYDISLEELAPNVETHGPESVFIWRITVNDSPAIYFRAGQSGAGERLCWLADITSLEGFLTELKPAHTQVIFAYA